MREDLLNELETEYAERRAENERTEAARASEIREKYPEIQRLKTQRQELVRGSIRRIGAGPVNGAAALTEQMAELNRRIREALKNAGLPEDYLAPVYRCPLCRDTGYTGEPVREPCSCLKEAYQRKLIQRIGLTGGQAETFETFDLELIPDEKEGGMAYSQREMSRVARERCEKWANQYPTIIHHTILINGKSGLGKTFLMHAMAARLAERGYSALTISSFQFLQTARKSFFENESGLDELISVPVLMLDDIGSEPLMKNVTIEALFTLINERQIRGLCTVLSSNLTTEELRERYTERITSRITDKRNCFVISLAGKDLRKIGGGKK